jgi:hypothetical protein
MALLHRSTRYTNSIDGFQLFDVDTKYALEISYGNDWARRRKIMAMLDIEASVEATPAAKRISRTQKA